MKPNLQAHLALFAANLIYGINYTVAKDVMPAYIGPAGFVLLRVVGALLLFWLSGMFYQKEKIDKKDFRKLIVCGLFGVAANQTLFFQGLNLTSPINASIIIVATPILVLVFATIIIKEKITSNKVIGVLMGICGALMLIFLKPENIGKLGVGNALGDLFILLNACSYAIFLVMAKPLMKKYKPLTVIKWVFLFGTIFVIPMGVWEAAIVNYQIIPFKIWLEIFFVIIFVTYLAYLLNIFALQTLSSAVVSAYIYLQPIFGAIIALTLAKDELNWIKILSAILIFVGVYLVSKPLKTNV